jgi:universal stress protein E
MQDHMTIQVILGTEYRRSPAVLRAMALAVKTNATLLLCSFEYQRGLARATRHGFDLDAYLKGREQKLEDFAALIRVEGFAVRTQMVWGHPAMSHIITSILATQPDFVVKDVHTEPAIRRVLFTPLDWQLLRECPAPLMLVREHTGNIPHHIMAAVDPLDEHDRPCELNDRILNFSAALAMQCDAKIEVVHAFDYVPVLADPEGAAGWVLDTTIYDELRALHKDALEKLADRFGVPDRQLHLLGGNPVVTLADYARTHDIDLLVMGTTNRTRLERLVMGSTAEGLLDNLDCDVLALKPLGFREQLVLLLDKQTDAAV